MESRSFVFAVILAALLILAFLCAATLSSTPEPRILALCEESVTAAAGETLREIAARCNTTVPALLAANPEIQDADAIQAGQVIRLPPAETVPASVSSEPIPDKPVQSAPTQSAPVRTEPAQSTMPVRPTALPGTVGGEGQVYRLGGGYLYTVGAGETLSSIARQFDTTVQTLLAANPEIVDPHRIWVGQVILVPVP